MSCFVGKTTREQISPVQSEDLAVKHFFQPKTRVFHHHHLKHHVFSGVQIKGGQTRFLFQEGKPEPEGPECSCWYLCVLWFCCTSVSMQTLSTALRFVFLNQFVGFYGPDRTRLCYLPQDVPDCMKYFYKDMVPQWGAPTAGAARVCQRFVNRSSIKLQNKSNKKHRTSATPDPVAPQVPLCHPVRHQPPHRRLLCLSVPAQQWRRAGVQLVRRASGGFTKHQKAAS